MSEQAFTAMAGAGGEGEAPEIGVGMLGYAFMGKDVPSGSLVTVAVDSLTGASSARARRQAQASTKK